MSIFSPRTIAQIGAGERLTMAGAAQSATIPTNTNLIRLAAEGGDLRWTLSGTATATSPGYLASGGVEWLEIPDTAALSIYGASGAYANLIYSR